MNNELTTKQIKRLEIAGFQGVDVNLETSLFEYGQLSAISETEILVLYARPMNNKGHYHFDYTRIHTDDLITDLEEIEEGFYSFIGQNKESYKHDLYAAIHAYRDNIINQVIFDINQYTGLYKESCAWDYENFDSLIENLF